MGPEISARERSKIIKKAKAITGYYSSSRKLRDEAIRDLFTALLSHIDASEYSYSTTRGWQIPYLVRTSL